MIHKFDRADADLSTRDNVFVLVDEAHRTTGGDLGNYLVGAIPQRDPDRIHRHADRPHGLRPGNVQDLRNRRREGLPRQVLDPRIHRRRDDPPAPLHPRPERHPRAPRAARAGVPRPGRGRGSHGHRGPQPDPRPGRQPEDLPEGRQARRSCRRLRREALPGERPSRSVTRRSSSASTGRRARSTRRPSIGACPPTFRGSSTPPHTTTTASSASIRSPKRTRRRCERPSSGPGRSRRS